MDSQFGLPAIVSPDKKVTLLTRVSLGVSKGDSAYDEKWLQDLVFRHPECLPLGEIDASYAPLAETCPLNRKVASTKTGSTITMSFTTKRIVETKNGARRRLIEVGKIALWTTQFPEPECGCPASL